MVSLPQCFCAWSDAARQFRDRCLSLTHFCPRTASGGCDGQVCTGGRSPRQLADRRGEGQDERPVRCRRLMPATAKSKVRPENAECLWLQQRVPTEGIAADREPLPNHCSSHPCDGAFPRWGTTPF